MVQIFLRIILGFGLLFLRDGHVIKERVSIAENGYPTFDSTPDTSFITFLGPELTWQLGEEDFSDEGVRMVVEKVFYRVDTGGDGYLDKHELADWVDINHRLNDAVEIKQEFKECDTNKDGLVSFQDFCEYGTDIPTRNEYHSSFTNKEGDIDVERFSHPIEKRDKNNIPNIAYNIKHQYQLFGLADVNDDGYLDWNEFVVFYKPEEFLETYQHATGMRYRHFDENHDERYSVEEFERYYTHNILIPELLAEKYRQPEDLFAKCDKDKDEYLSYEEADKCITSFVAVNHENIEWLLQDADLDGDGRLSLEEVVDSFDTITGSDDYYMGRDEL